MLRKLEKLSKFEYLIAVEHNTLVHGFHGKVLPGSVQFNQMHTAMTINNSNKLINSTQGNMMTSEYEYVKLRWQQGKKRKSKQTCQCRRIPKA